MNILNSRGIKSVRFFLNSDLFKNGLAKTIVLLVIWGLGLIPTYIGIALYFLLSPSTFWQILVTLILLLLFLGSIQAAIIIVMVVLSIALISEKI